MTEMELTFGTWEPSCKCNSIGKMNTPQQIPGASTGTPGYGIMLIPGMSCEVCRRPWRYVWRKGEIKVIICIHHNAPCRIPEEELWLELTIGWSVVEFKVPLKVVAEGEEEDRYLEDIKRAAWDAAPEPYKIEDILFCEGCLKIIMVAIKCKRR